jgi:hypothetical protein
VPDQAIKGHAPPTEGFAAVDIPTFEQAVADPHALARFQVWAWQAARPPAPAAKRAPGQPHDPYADTPHSLGIDMARASAIGAWNLHLLPYANALAAETSAREAHTAEKSSATRKQLKQAIQAREEAETSARAWWDTQQGHLGEAAAKAAGPKPWQPPQAPRVQAVMFTN